MRKSEEKERAPAPRRRGRLKRWSEDMVARFEAGTFDRIAAVSSDGEDRTDFVREAVRRELDRREASQPRKGAKSDPR